VSSYFPAIFQLELAKSTVSRNLIHIPNRSTLVEAENNKVKFTFRRVVRKSLSKACQRTEVEYAIPSPPKGQNNHRGVQFSNFFTWNLCRSMKAKVSSFTLLSE